MNGNVRYIILLVLGSLLISGNTVVAQRISFGLYAQDGIIITPQDPNELNFNDKQAVILGGQTISVDLNEAQAAVVAIEARADLDVTVTIDADPKLTLGTNPVGIPLSVNMAYSNLGASTSAIAKTQAIRVPNGFTSVTFPVVRRSSGAPAPPPTPDHVGYTAPKATAYLFIYGTLGPVPNNAAAGLYSGDINIRVEYSTY